MPLAPPGQVWIEMYLRLALALTGEGCQPCQVTCKFCVIPNYRRGQYDLLHQWLKKLIYLNVRQLSCQGAPCVSPQRVIK